jgi:hypothetical protein
VRPNLTKVLWADAEAESEWDRLEDWQTAEIDEDETRDGILGRVAENGGKLATLRALSRDPANPAVTVADVRWARAIMMESIRAIDSGIEQHMHCSALEGVMAAILRHLRGAKRGEMFKSKMLGRSGIRGVSDQAFNDAIKRLRDIGKIELDGSTLRLLEDASATS